ncbi:glycosyltransferase family 9 protein [Sulfurospirillum sp. 1612]|uniref:glycosyltransferase family 9 protein n=1 Tax=Sulfurospirillum sp. 1612 TaxID=3094835 RepID=UPI002F945570
MNIFIELPTWLGDAIMTTPAIEEILEIYPDAKISFFGSYVSTEALKTHPNCSHIILDESKKSKSRFLWLYKTAKSLGTFDLAISFRSSFSTKALLYFVDAKQKFQYKKNHFRGHQVEKYSHFIATSLQIQSSPKALKLYQKPHHFTRPTLGINPGATYGSAKRWYPDEFAKVADYFAKDFDIVIFGGPGEIKIANEVAEHIRAQNVTNLAGKTSIQSLIQQIAGLSLFVSNDSGPMHIAAAYQVPTVALFGPTRYDETAPWQNPNSFIISHDLACAPCMKRVCPIHTHECMKGIKAAEVITRINAHLKTQKVI